MTDKTIEQDYDERPISPWTGDEIIPAIKELGSPLELVNAAGLASALATYINGLATLARLLDVDVAGSPSPIDGQTLTYHAATQKWIASTPISALARLTDVDISGSPSPVDGMTLTFHAATQKWIASTPVSGSTSLAALTDTDLAGSPSPANGQVLTYIASLGKWVASTPGTGASTLATLTDVDIAGSPSPVDGQTLTYHAATGKWIATTPSSTSTQGRHATFIAAGSMSPSVTGGCASLARIATSANHPDIATLDHDATTQEYHQFFWVFPKSYNLGTVSAVPVWRHAATTTNFGVVWDLQAVATRNDDTIDVAFGTAQTSTDTGGTTSDFYAGPETSAITIAGTLAAEGGAWFRGSRVTGNGSDTMAIDAGLLGWVIFFTTNADTDA